MMKYFFICSLILILLSGFISCSSQPDLQEPPIPAQPDFLPLADGWYSYDFMRTYRGIENEYSFFQSTGMRLFQELTWKQKGTITYAEGGIFRDPLLDIIFTTDAKGSLRALNNPTITGKINNDGSFFWSGRVDQYETLNNVFVEGVLTFIPREMRADNQYDGLYHIINSATGRQQLCRVSDGFYTWIYVDKKEGDLLEPLPLMVTQDGTFSFSLEVTNILEMGETASTNNSVESRIEGQIIPGNSLQVQEITKSSTKSGDTNYQTPTIYGGIIIREGLYPNEAIPADVKDTIQRPVHQYKTAERFNSSSYPEWYFNPPVKPGFVYATGEKTFNDRETALTLATVIAAADIAVQMKVILKSELMNIQNNFGQNTDHRLSLESIEQLNYRVVEQLYDSEKSTAFVLIEAQLY